MRLLILTVFTLLANWAQAQVFMRPFDNAAAMGMGGATISLPSLVNGMANEAQLGLGQKLGVLAGTALPYGISDWQSAHFQAIIGLNKYSGIGLGLYHSGTDLYSEQRLQAAYGRQLGERFHLGAALQLLHNNAFEYGKQTTAVFSLGLLAQALPKLWIAARTFNPMQQKMGEDNLPSIFQVGATWKPTELFSIALETEKNLGVPTQIKMGVEYHPAKAVVIRAGTRSGKTARMALGLGLKFKSKLQIDMGTEWHPTLGLTPAAMVSWSK
jgi:hypothetical protein